MSLISDELASLAIMQQTLIGNTGLLDVNANTGGIAGPPSAPTYIKRPWIDPPEGSASFDPQNGIALPGVPGDTAVLTFTVDIGYDGVINAISHNFIGGGFTQFSGDIVWRLLINGKAVRNFSNMTAEKGTIEHQRVISPIRVFSGDVVTYVVNHVANPGLNGSVICSITGYTYPNRGT